MPVQVINPDRVAVDPLLPGPGQTGGGGFIKKPAPSPDDFNLRRLKTSSGVNQVIAKSGETIDDVVRRGGGSSRLEEILNLNPQITTRISEGTLEADITPGQVINLPPGQNLQDLLRDGRGKTEKDLEALLNPSIDAGSLIEGDPLSPIEGFGGDQASSLADQLMSQTGELQGFGGGQATEIPKERRDERYLTAQSQRVLNEIRAGEWPSFINRRTQLLLGFSDEFLENNGYYYDGNKWVGILLQDTSKKTDLGGDGGYGFGGSSRRSFFGGGGGAGGRTQFLFNAQLMGWRIGFG